MKKLKYEILFTVLFMTVGIAAVSSNILFSGSTQLASNSDDFLVYFSDVLVDGEQAMSLVQNETSLVFTGEFSAVGDKKEITYDITNASMNYDADIDITCTQSTAYLTITNSFDTDSYLSARSTRTGVLTITLSKSYIGTGLTQDISCTINASAAERNSQGSDVVPEPFIKKYAIGTEISIGDEKFNIISESEDVVTMLAQYNIGTDSGQTTSQMAVYFADKTGWEYTPGPKEIDVQTWGGESKTVLNNYVSYLKTEYAVDVIGDLITLSELGSLGCVVPTDYASGSDGWTCSGSYYKNWLVTGQRWWTRSASSDSSHNIWGILTDGDLYEDFYDFSADKDYGIRPTITISKELCDDLLEGMVFFTVNDTAYKAKDGMTWLEFVDSEYNTGGFVENDGRVFSSSGDYVAIDYSHVLSSETIVFGNVYKTISEPPPY